MKNKLIYFIINTSLVLTILGCQKENIETEPEKIIIGKWEFYGYDFYNDSLNTVTPTQYKQYKNDSIYVFNYELNTYNNIGHYRIDENHLYENITYGSLYEYSYEFYDDNNKMVLNQLSPSLYSPARAYFKRIK